MHEWEYTDPEVIALRMAHASACRRIERIVITVVFCVLIPLILFWVFIA